MLVPLMHQNSQELARDGNQVVIQERSRVVLGQISPFIQNRIGVSAHNNEYHTQSIIDFNTAVLDQMKQIKMILEAHAKEKILLKNRITTLESEKKIAADTHSQQMKALEEKNNQLKVTLDNVLYRLSSLENTVTTHYNIFQKALYEAGNGAFPRILSLDTRLRAKVDRQNF